MANLIKKSILAALLISFGVFVLAVAPVPIGTFLFAFGLMAICYFDGQLYTGKCGYVFENKQFKQLPIILLINLLFGWIFGWLISIMNPLTIEFAQTKFLSWSSPGIHLLQSIGCGIIMFLAVDIKKQTSSIMGILFGIPLFIFCGFQHSIANIIICGIAHTISPYMIISIIGNFIGSILVWSLIRP